MKNNQIKEINQHISDALEQWQNVMLKADADEWACCFDQKPCTENCEYLGDFIFKLNEE